MPIGCIPPSALFDQGYGRHLTWHRGREDSLSWFGWDVLVGPGLGRFVDGAFGMPFAALDARVDPAGDAADAAVNVRPYADPVSRELVVLRRDLSTATPLEDGTPSRFVEVMRYPAPPGTGHLVESALQRLVTQASQGSLHPHTVI